MATGSPLNEAQQRRLLSHAKYADELLSDVEAILNASESKSIFPKYVSDVSLTQAKLIRNYIVRFRDQLARVMDGLGIVHAGPAFGSVHSIRTTLAFVRISVQEMAPHYLRGYGEVSENVLPQLQGLCVELEGLVERLDSLLAQGSAADLQARLERLQKTAGGVELLQLLDRIITDRGLVELRPRLSMIAERFESHQFEIAVFGRVSSGKSSLLNHILQTAVLPVGVNPITAVPTRLIYGREALLTVTFADRRQERLPIKRLPEFVSEVHNPANVKGVVRLVVELPSERLRSGLGFVDTPGLGSLATAGAAETLAYLPQCDLGVVLISAGIPLNDEDLATIRLLYEAAIPVKVLLSKADLLDPSDLDSALTYTARQIRTQMGVEIDVHPVGSAHSHADLLERWFAGELAPLYEKHQKLAQESIRRKTGALREAVELILRAKLNKAGTSRAPNKKELLALESDLRGAAGKLEDTRAFCLRASDEIRRLTPCALDEAANALLEAWAGAAANGSDPGAVVATAIARTAGTAAQVHAYLQDLARSLTAVLQRTARALARQDGPAEEDLLQPLREMPRFDPPPLSPSFRRPWPLYPRVLARRRIYGDLRSTLEQPLSEAFSTHGRLVEHWARRALAELQLAFDSSADAYRAQLARLIGQGTVTVEERQAILDDLASLAEVGGQKESAANLVTVEISATSEVERQMAGFD
jgi:GTP-binding protein EngB required for normal cell division